MSTHEELEKLGYSKEEPNQEWNVSPVIVNKKSSNEITREKVLEEMKMLGIGNDLTKEEGNLFINLAILHQLSPILKEIYPIKHKSQKGDTFNVVIAYTVYIDRAEASGQLKWWDVIVNDTGPDGKKLVMMDWTATCRILKKGDKEPRTFKIWFSDYTTGKSTWLSRPHSMIEKCAITNAMRKVFPTALPYASEELWFANKSNEEFMNSKDDEELKKLNVPNKFYG